MNYHYLTSNFTIFLSFCWRLMTVDGGKVLHLGPYNGRCHPGLVPKHPGNRTTGSSQMRPSLDAWEREDQHIHIYI